MHLAPKEKPMGRETTSPWPHPNRCGSRTVARSTAFRRNGSVPNATILSAQTPYHKLPARRSPMPAAPSRPTRLRRDRPMNVASQQTLGNHRMRVFHSDAAESALGVAILRRPLTNRRYRRPCRQCRPGRMTRLLGCRPEARIGTGCPRRRPAILRGTARPIRWGWQGQRGTAEGR